MSEKQYDFMQQHLGNAVSLAEKHLRFLKGNEKKESNPFMPIKEQIKNQEEFVKYGLSAFMKVKRARKVFKKLTS